MNPSLSRRELLGAAAAAVLLPGAAFSAPVTSSYDVIVYGGVPGGVAAAVAAARNGAKTLLIEQTRHVGGLSTSGVNTSEIEHMIESTYGGIAMEFYRRIGKHYGFDLPQYRWESHVAEQIYLQMLKEAGVEVWLERRFQDASVEGGQIKAISFDDGQFQVAARVFIDATYEGDLFAKAGVSYSVGRESNSEYGETVNGFNISKTHQFRFDVDPYRMPGDPKSGLLPGVWPDPLPEKGTGDHKIQAYNFRMWAVKAADGHPWPKPANYNADDYALLLRYLTTKIDFPWDWTYRFGPVKLNLGDCNNAGPISTDFVGGNYDWPEADYATREKIFQAHVTYQQGMMWFLAHDERLPERIREKVNQFALPTNQFVETDGWPHELYVREARRMKSDYVMTEKNCASAEVAKDSVGLASYTMDSHPVQRVIIDGAVRGEGCVELKTPHPYPVSYRSLTPKASECDNLLVPVCLSSTHIAYGSIRMEPVFMILGQSAATAAVIAIDDKATVQAVAYGKLRERLVADRQKLDWSEPAK